MGYDCTCDYDRAEVYNLTTPKARKRYHCEECNGFIEPGEQYENVFGKWEGYVSTLRTCERCCDIRQWVKNNVPCFCWAHGSMIDDAREAVQEAADRAPKETIGLRFGLLRRLAKRDRFNAERRKAIAA